MQFYKDLEKRKELIGGYLRKNPRATFKDIKKNLHTKVNNVYARGMEEAYSDAGINPPRTFNRMTQDEKRQIIIDYIKKNPTAGGHTIMRNTKINFQTIFKNTEEMFKTAGVPYLRNENNLLKKRSLDEKKDILVRIIKDDPLISAEEIIKKSKISFYHHFHDIKKLYQEAGVKYINKGLKRKLNKQKIVIEFIKNSSFATQREINRVCKTKVQELFKRGIFEAYEKAGVPFPYKRLKLHGTVLKEVKDAAVKFEEDIARKLSGYGTVNKLARTKRGIADIILERKGKKIAIELKNYKSHEISISQIKQLNRYMEDINTSLGFLVCLKKPKRDTFLIGENRIFIVLESELSKIPEYMDLYFSGKIFGSSI